MIAECLLTFGSHFINQNARRIELLLHLGQRRFALLHGGRLAATTSSRCDSAAAIHVFAFTGNHRFQPVHPAALRLGIGSDKQQLHFTRGDSQGQCSILLQVTAVGAPPRCLSQQNKSI